MPNAADPTFPSTDTAAPASREPHDKTPSAILADATTSRPSYSKLCPPPHGTKDEQLPTASGTISGRKKGRSLGSTGKGKPSVSGRARGGRVHTPSADAAPKLPPPTLTGRGRPKGSLGIKKRNGGAVEAGQSAVTRIEKTPGQEKDDAGPSPPLRVSPPMRSIAQSPVDVAGAVSSATRVGASSSGSAAATTGGKNKGTASTSAGGIGRSALAVNSATTTRGIKRPASSSGRFYCSDSSDSDGAGAGGGGGGEGGYGEGEEGEGRAGLAWAEQDFDGGWSPMASAGDESGHAPGDKRDNKENRREPAVADDEVVAGRPSSSTVSNGGACNGTVHRGQDATAGDAAAAATPSLTGRERTRSLSGSSVGGNVNQQEECDQSDETDVCELSTDSSDDETISVVSGTAAGEAVGAAAANGAEGLWDKNAELADGHDSDKELWMEVDDVKAGGYVRDCSKGLENVPMPVSAFWWGGMGFARQCGDVFACLLLFLLFMVMRKW